MAEALPPSESDSAPVRRRNWDVSAIIAALIGLLALCVSGYTAYIQRQQVRAQVWPWLVAGNDDNALTVDVYNKGVGPAIVRSAQIFVDGKPQSDWMQVFESLGSVPHQYSQASVNQNVLTPGETVHAVKFSDREEYQRFRAAALNRMTMKVCFCSTLGECWMYSDRHPVGYKSLAQLVQPIRQCPRLRPAEIFNN